MTPRWTDNQWWAFLCGFQAGLKIKNLALPNIDNSITLFPIGVGGSGEIGMAMPTVVYDGVTSQGIGIPVYTHDVDIEYGAFSVNISWDPSIVQFVGVAPGDFGSIGPETSSSEIRYTYSSGVFKARGIKSNASNFKNPIILFYIIINLIRTDFDRCELKFHNNSLTDLEYSTLMTWVNDPVAGDVTYFITPIVNVDGVILGEGEKSDSSESVVGDDNSIGAPASPSGVYVGTAFTPPGQMGVVPIYVNSNMRDNFPYNRVKCSVEVADPDNLIEYISVNGAGGFEVVVTTSNLSNGHLLITIEATRQQALIDAITFCYISYRVAAGVDKYMIPLRCLNAELGN